MNFTILKLVANRILVGLGSLLAVSAVVFAITAVLPGDAAEEKLGQDATPEAVAALRKEMGLDRSAVLRYFDWLGGMARVMRASRWSRACRWVRLSTAACRLRCCWPR